MTTMPPRPAHRRGDVVLVLFPHSDLRTAKLRPALVVQADNLHTGLLTDSVVMTDNLATIAESAIDRVIGTVPMADVERALRHTLNL